MVSWGGQKTKAQVVVAIRWRVVVTHSRPAIPGVIVPGAAPGKPALKMTPQIVG